MQPLLAQLQLVDIKVPGLKGRLFNLIVDMPPRQFDQLCSEVVALYRFQKKYRDALVTDAPHLIRPFVHLLPRVELLVELNDQAYDRNAFYRWLETVNDSTLQQIIMEIDALYDEAVENIDCYVVDEKICSDKPADSCWKMQLETSGNVEILFKALRTWKMVQTS
jgi:hypothetical protein